MLRQRMRLPLNPLFFFHFGNPLIGGGEPGGGVGGTRVQRIAIQGRAEPSALGVVPATEGGAVRGGGGEYHPVGVGLGLFPQAGSGLPGGGSFIYRLSIYPVFAYRFLYFPLYERPLPFQLAFQFLFAGQYGQVFGGEELLAVFEH